MVVLSTDMSYIVFHLRMMFITTVNVPGMCFCFVCVLTARCYAKRDTSVWTVRPFTLLYCTETAKDIIMFSYAYKPHHTSF